MRNNNKKHGTFLIEETHQRHFNSITYSQSGAVCLSTCISLIRNIHSLKSAHSAIDDNTDSMGTTDNGAGEAITHTLLLVHTRTACLRPLRSPCVVLLNRAAASLDVPWCRSLSVLIELGVLIDSLLLIMYVSRCRVAKHSHVRKLKVLGAKNFSCDTHSLVYNSPW